MQRRQRLSNIGGSSWSNTKYVTGTYRALIIFTNFGGYKTLRPRLTKYCWGCVPGMPGGRPVSRRISRRSKKKFRLNRRGLC